MALDILNLFVVRFMLRGECDGLFSLIILSSDVSSCGMYTKVWLSAVEHG